MAFSLDYHVVSVKWNQSHLNSMAPKHPLSSTCFNSSCWNLINVVSDLPWIFPQSRSGELGDVLLAAAVEVNPTNLPADLVETDVVETFEARPVDCPHPVVWHEEVFLPAHKDELLVRHIHGDIAALARLLLIGSEGRELGPVREINLVCCAPRWVLGHEAVVRADDLAFKIRSQGRVVVRQTCMAVRLI